MRFLRLLTLMATVILATGAVNAQAPAKAADKAAKTVDKAAKAAPKAAATAEKAASGALIDINSATAAELKTIPGVGDAYSAAIIKGRPYANKAQLKSRGLIPAGVYEKIKDKIIAKQ